MPVHIAETRDDLRRIAPVLLELRSQLDETSLVEQLDLQMRDGYRIAYVESGGEIRCVAGFVVTTKLAWGKHIYVDDLVTAGRHRSKGAGAEMMRWLKAHARELGCEQLHLDSGVQRFAAHRFYMREGFEISSHHFSITGLDEPG